MISELLLFENVCYAISTVYYLVFCSDQFLDTISNLYQSNILMRYLYLYLLTHLPFNPYPYIFILHVPGIHNSFIEPIITLLFNKIVDIFVILLKITCICIFIVSLRVHPETQTIKPHNIYWNIINIYNSDIFTALYFITLLFMLKILRTFSYSNYKFYKYIFYYKYNFNYQTNYIFNTFDYFNEIITRGYYQPFVNTPLFAHYIIYILPETCYHILRKLYIYNLLSCWYMLFPTYKILLNILMYFTDFNRQSKIVYFSRLISIFCIPSMWLPIWLLITDEILIIFKTCCKKYSINLKTKPVINFDENFFEHGFKPIKIE